MALTQRAYEIISKVHAELGVAATPDTLYDKAWARLAEPLEDGTRDTAAYRPEELRREVEARLAIVPTR